MHSYSFAQNSQKSHNRTCSPLMNSKRSPSLCSVFIFARCGGKPYQEISKLWTLCRASTHLFQFPKNFLNTRRHRNIASLSGSVLRLSHPDIILGHFIGLWGTIVFFHVVDRQNQEYTETTRTWETTRMVIGWNFVSIYGRGSSIRVEPRRYTITHNSTTTALPHKTRWEKGVRVNPTKRVKRMLVSKKMTR